jgi:hypothetical protein
MSQHTTPVRTPAARLLQMSFASCDAMNALKYYDMVNQHTHGWSMCEMLAAGNIT